MGVRPVGCGSVAAGALGSGCGSARISTPPSVLPSGCQPLGAGHVAAWSTQSSSSVEIRMQQPTRRSLPAQPDAPAPSHRRCVRWRLPSPDRALHRSLSLRCRLFVARSYDVNNPADLSTALLGGEEASAGGDASTKMKLVLLKPGNEQGMKDLLKKMENTKGLNDGQGSAATR